MTVFAPRGLDRAYRAAINARRRHRDEEAAVEPCIPRFQRPVAGVMIESHERIMNAAPHRRSPFSDITARRAVLAWGGDVTVSQAADTAF
jgi:hypothetical protein